MMQQAWASMDRTGRLAYLNSKADSQKESGVSAYGVDLGVLRNEGESDFKFAHRLRGMQKKKDIGDVWDEVTLTSLIPFASGASEAMDIYSVYDGVQAMQDGSATKPQQRAVLEFLIDASRGSTFAYKAGSIVADLPAFMGEFIATGGIYNLAKRGGLKLLSKGLREAIEKKALKKAGVKVLDSTMKKAVEREAARVLARKATTQGVASKAAEVALTRVPTMMAASELGSVVASKFMDGEGHGGRIAASTWGRALPNMGVADGPDEAGQFMVVMDDTMESFQDALPRGLMDNYIEFVSEHAGGALTKLTGLDKLHVLQLGILEHVGKGNVSKSIQKVLKASGWHGVMGEFLEERAGALGRALVPGMEEDFSDIFPSIEQGAAELLAFSLLPAGAAGISLAESQLRKDPLGLRGLANQVAQGKAPLKASLANVEDGEVDAAAQAGVDRMNAETETESEPVTIQDVPEEHQEPATRIEEAGAAAGVAIRWYKTESGKPAAKQGMQAAGGVVLLDAALLEREGSEEAILGEIAIHEFVHDMGSKDRNVLDSMLQALATNDPKGFAAAMEGVQTDAGGAISAALLPEEGAAYLAQGLMPLLDYMATEEGGAWVEAYVEQADRPTLQRIVDFFRSILKKFGLGEGSQQDKQLAELAAKIGTDTPIEDLRAGYVIHLAMQGIRDMGVQAPGGVAEVPRDAESATARKRGERRRGVTDRGDRRRAARLRTTPLEPETEPDVTEPLPANQTPRQAKRARLKRNRAHAREVGQEQVKREAEQRAERANVDRSQRRKPTETRAERAARLYDEGEERVERFSPAPRVGSKKFERWFGASKVVDGNGKPLVVYHGTRKDFSEFDGKPGAGTFFGQTALFFDTDPEYSEAISTGEHGRILPVYLSMSNPLLVKTPERSAYDPSFEASELARAKRLGYDGVIFETKDAEFHSLYYAVFNPNQIKSATGNTGAYGQRPPTDSEAAGVGMTASEALEAQGRGDVRFSPAPVDRLGFFAQAEQAILDAAQKKYTKGQVRSRLKNGGVKDEELFWMGLDDWLKDKNGRITKEELLEFIRGNGVTVDEKVLEDADSEAMVEIIEGWAEFESGNKTREELLEDLEATGEDVDTEELRVAWQDRATNDPGGWGFPFDEYQDVSPGGPNDAKFAQAAYQLPGGENYRELLLTLPERGTVGVSVAYTGGHYGDTPNVLAHIRFNERIDSEGKRMLFIEEIQSDWHADGRTHGYAQPGFEVFNTKSGNVVEVFDTEDEARAFVNDRVGLDYDSRSGGETVPHAPFKTSWETLAMKRMVRWAAENGFDKVGWTTGAQQVKRYSDATRQVVDSMSWGANKDGSKGLTIYPSAGGTKYDLDLDERGVVTSSTLDGALGNPIEDVVGKSIATRIMAEESGTVEGDDLTIGGKGMHAAYDVRLRNIARKIGKRFGAKVGTVDIDVGNGSSESFDLLDDGDVVRSFSSLNDAEMYVAIEEERGALHPMSSFEIVRHDGTGLATVHALPITASMRESVMETGFSRFSPRGAENLKRVIADAAARRNAKAKGVSAPPEPSSIADELPTQSKKSAIPASPSEPPPVTSASPGDHAGVTSESPPATPTRVEVPPEFAEFMPDVDERVSRLHALMGSEVTGRPDLAKTAASEPGQQVQDVVDELRNFEGIPEARELLEDQQRARARVDADPEGMHKLLLHKVATGAPLNAEETFALRELTNRFSELALRTNDKDAWREATRLNWAYRTSGSEVSAAFRSRQQQYNEKVRAEHLVSLILARPTLKTDKKLRRLMKQRQDLIREGNTARRKGKERSSPAPDRFSTAKLTELEKVNRKIEALLDKETERGEKIRLALEEHGYDPDNITEEMWADPATATNLIRIIGPARASTGDKAREYLYAAMLSNPTTQATNIVGNGLSIAISKYLQDIVEATINLAMKDPNARTMPEVKLLFTEFVSAIKAGTTALADGYKIEPMADKFGAIQANKLAEGVHAPAISDETKVGWVYNHLLKKMSLTSLHAFDQAAKGFIEHIALRQLALRHAHRSGAATAEEIRARMDEFLEDPRLLDEVQREALFLTFQDKLEEAPFYAWLEESAFKLREVADLIPFFGTLHVPFIGVAVRLLRQTLRRSPLQLGLLAAKLIGGLYHGKHITKKELVTDFADTVISAMFFFSVLAMMGIGDDDDLPILGGSPEDWKNKAATGLQRATAQPYTLRIGGETYNFKGRDPVSGAVALTIDMVQGIRAGGLTHGLIKTLKAAVRNVGDQPYMQGLHDVEQIMAGQKSGIDYAVGQFATPWIPNVYRGTVRAFDHSIRERAAWKRVEGNAAILHRAAYSLTGRAFAPPPKWDVWGRAVERKPLGVMNGLILKQNISSGTAMRGDILLYNWDQFVKSGKAAAEDKMWYPVLPRPNYTKRGKNIEWTPEEYSNLTQNTGELFREAVEKHHWRDIHNPTAKDIDAMKKMQSRARRRAKLLVQRGTK